jgi:hypothetical protein
MPGLQPSARARTPLLARLKVGTKLMLLVLLPVCVLLGFTSLTALADWRAASGLQGYRTATRLSVATAAVADRLAAERTAAVLLRLRPGWQAQAGLAAAQREVDQACTRPRAVPRAGTEPWTWPAGSKRPGGSWRPCGSRSPAGRFLSRRSPTRTE